ncbi:50S ribosomal protein L19 [Candidatus Peribacteria bacterium]|nr:MAG: 50S ribosomal protein L19 [Candidatus Peribacteria bacterium]
MSSHIIQAQAKSFVRAVPDILPGYTVRVHEKIQEGGKERVQIFEGLVINVHKGHVPTDRSFTVRKIVSGIGVEKVFALHSPVIDKIEVKKVAKTRRAKLFFMRGRTGKAARMLERFTTEGEFAVAPLAVPEEAEIASPEVMEEVMMPATEAVEAPVAEVKAEDAPAVEEPAA